LSFYNAFSFSLTEVTIKALKEKLEQYERSLQDKNTEEALDENQDRSGRESRGENLPNNYADQERLALTIAQIQYYINHNVYVVNS